MTKEEYNLYDIRTLRIIGREKGVNAPTRLKKAALIEQIIAVENGIVEPVHAEGRTKGRPPFNCNLSLKSSENEPIENSEMPSQEENISQPVNNNDYVNNENYVNNDNYDNYNNNGYPNSNGNSNRYSNRNSNRYSNGNFNGNAYGKNYQNYGGYNSNCNYNRAPQGQRYVRKHEYVIQRLKTIQNILEEIFDYIIDDSFR